MTGDHIFARVPSLVDGAVRVFEQEIANGATPQAAMRAVLDRALSLHTTALAGKQRAGTEDEDRVAAIGRVKALHQPDGGDPYDECTECYDRYPCCTIRALEGEQA